MAKLLERSKFDPRATEQPAAGRTPGQGAERPEQKTGFLSGNEMAALAARQINFHVMGYYPITPSTEIAEILSAEAAQGKHDIVMIPADGEHGAAGICYGASTGGGRVFNATSANGLLYALEQLPVQSGTRFPMVMDLVTRSVSGPLDIRGDHSDLYFAIHTGWIVLLARDPQAVYDMNIMAVRISEHPDVQLPVIVAYDGFFTSHQKRRVQFFENEDVVQQFIGEAPPRTTALDPRNPVTIGPYMNDPDLINNKYQLHRAMEAARSVVADVFAEYGRLSGRSYPTLDLYRMEDADVALLLLNSAAETAKDAADRLRDEGLKVGVISPNVLRPFPAASIMEACRNVKALLVAERGDSPGAGGGPLTHEVKSALKDDPDNETSVLSRIYGLGGRDFYLDDAEKLFRIAARAAEQGAAAPARFDYFGVTKGDPERTFAPGTPPLSREEMTGLVSVTQNPETGELKVSVPPPRRMMKRPKRIAPGHGACPGCGIFPALNQFLSGIEGDVVVLYQTGCAMVVTTGYPFSSHRVTYLHNLFQNGAPTLSGLVEMFYERQRRGEIDVGEDITFVMITGDGGMDIGMGSAIGTALRNHNMIILEYDNEGYMNTGSQLSYSTPFGHMTSTSAVGPHRKGKGFHHKDTAQIMAATNIPYVFTGVESHPQDLVRKAAKAQWYAKNEGLVYGKVLIACPLNWRSVEKDGAEIVNLAVESCFFPLYEIERGITNITYDPERRNKRVPVAQWLKTMGKTRHLLREENKDLLDEIEAEVERRWQRLKAMHEHPLL